MSSTKARTADPHDEMSTHDVHQDVVREEESNLQLGQAFAVDATELPRNYYYSPNVLGTFLATGMSIAAAFGGFSYIGPILLDIGTALGGTKDINWVSYVYTLMLSIGLLLVGRLTDIFGRRWFFIIGSIVGLVGSIVCATAQDVPTVIGGQTLIGLGASVGVSYPLILGEIVPIKHRFLANGSIYVFAIGTTALGAAVANAFILHTHLGWRWCYYLVAIFNGVALVCWFAFYHPPTFAMKWGTARKIQFIKRFDYLGAFLYVAGLLLFLLGISWGGSTFPWNSAAVISSIIIGAALLAALPCWELYARLSEPLIPLHILDNRGYVASVICLAMGASVYYAFAVLWPSMVSNVYSNGDRMWDGWVSCLVGIPIVAGEMVGGFFIEKIGKVKYQCIVCSTLGTVFLACTAACTPETRGTAMAMVTVSCFLFGWVEVIVLSTSSICIKDQREVGTALGLAGSVRSGVSAVFSAIYQVIFSARITKTVSGYVVPAVAKAGLPSASIAPLLTALSTGDTHALANIEGLNPRILAVAESAFKYAYMAAFRTVFLSTIAFGALAIISSYFVPNVESLMTLEVSTTLHSYNNTQTVGQKTLSKGDEAGVAWSDPPPPIDVGAHDEKTSV